MPGLARLKDMNMKTFIHFSIATRFVVMVAAGLVMGWVVPCARANVFASNIQLNQTSTNLITDPGDSVTIYYLLNQNADAGVTVALFYGTNTVWSTNRTGGGPGTLRGTNAVVWNGVGNNGQVVGSGIWLVRVTASTLGGATNWNLVPMRDNTPSSLNGDGYVWSPQGIAVNNNTNSAFFGRVFVGNAEPSGSGSEPGDLVGIGKYNADGGYAAEGAFSTGGWLWAGNNSSPWKIEVDADDRVHVVDGASQSAVISFDQLISSNSMQRVLATNNMVGSGVNYAGLAITGNGTNRQMYSTDIDSGGPNGVGVRRWKLAASGAIATNDTGITVVSTTPSQSLDLFPQDVAVDSSNRIFVIQYLPGAGASTNRVLGFPAYQSNALTTATWTVTDTALINAFGIAAALHTNYLGVVCREDVGRAISIFNRDTGVPMGDQGLNAYNNTSHDYTDVAWDRAGNLYVTDWSDGRWRVFSPPGGNQFTTLALQTVRVGVAQPPTLSQPLWQGGQFTVNVNGDPGFSYAVDSSTNLVTWSPTTTNLSQSVVTPFTIPAPLSRTFYRARVVP